MTVIQLTIHTKTKVQLQPCFPAFVQCVVTVLHLRVSMQLLYAFDVRWNVPINSNQDL